MPFKNPEDKTNWQKKYYHDKDLKKVQTDRARLNYWRKKYCKIALITIEEFKKSNRMDWSIERIKDNCDALKEMLKLD